MSTTADKFGANLDVDKLLALARIAETAERYEDMCEFTSRLVVHRCNKKRRIKC